MANVFRKSMNYEPKMPRNSKDMSFDNNLTTKFGQITPIFCQYLNAGESVSIKTDIAIQFKPTVFPLQTPVRASVHFFKVPARILMEHGVFEDFRYGNRSDVVLPYHSPDVDGNWKNMFKSGGLMDYLGVPTTYFGSGEYRMPFSVDGLGSWRRNIKNIVVNPSSLDEFCNIINSRSLTPLSNPFGSGLQTVSVIGDFPVFELPYVIPSQSILYGDFVDITDYLPIVSIGSYITQSSGNFGVLLADYVDGSYVNRICLPSPNGVINSREETLAALNALNLFAQSCKGRCHFYPFYYRFNSATLTDDVFPSWYVYHGHLMNGVDWVDLPGSESYLRRLSPLSFFARAYEECYNAYFRNENVDPLLVNGNPVYNKYLTNYADGPDDTFYDLHFRNWDDDFLTTAYKSPQLGQAPLVGITSVNPAGFGSNKGTMSVSTPDGGIANIGYETDVDGKIIKLDNKDLEEQSSTVRSEAIKAVTEGISINDFRNVNAFQIWLERSIRRGRKFVDQQRAHTGVDARSIELDMPEFIGGFSRMVNVSKVNDTTSEGLGDYAGQLSLFASGNHTITEYCDQPCVIIGMLTVIPQAAYSQLMPKFYSRRVATDFFDPAFNKIGLQPITYREVCPIQALVEGKNVDDVFGYQIPWYEDQSMVDEVHGQMRQISMRDRLMNRTFGVTPELSRDFLRIDPEQVNDVFPDRNPDDDPIVGQIHFTYYKKTQIYNAHVPGLM